MDFVEVGSGPSALHPPVTAFRAFDPAPPHGDPRWTCLLRISEERLLEAGVSPRPPDRAVALPPPELTQRTVHAPDASTELTRALAALSARLPQDLPSAAFDPRCIGHASAAEHGNPASIVASRRSIWRSVRRISPSTLAMSSGVAGTVMSSLVIPFLSRSRIDRAPGYLAAVPRPATRNTEVVRDAPCPTCGRLDLECDRCTPSNSVT